MAAAATTGTDTEVAQQTSQNATEESEETPSSHLLNRVCRVTIQDGRVLVGILKCFDRDRNMVLAEAEEYRTPEEVAKEDEPERRKHTMGMVMVPGDKLCKFEMSDTTF
eukprot:gb/GECG01009127.1/.p1 GENE.gb/GECG01009127.1/~~gb/GECG01009127.1/.p1  ORF type:complete len:109 (+),score=21.25 gb/GECG01009127.1/:1-327(+)